MLSKELNKRLSRPSSEVENAAKDSIRPYPKIVQGNLLLGQYFINCIVRIFDVQLLLHWYSLNNVPCSYYQCVNERRFRQQCSPGLHWSAARNSCDYPENSGCRGSSAESASRKRFRREAAVGDGCTAGEMDYKRDPRDCGKYLQ